MNKTIYIGELALNVSLCADGHADTGVGDWAVNAAVLDGQMGLPTIWVGEAADGTVGDHIIDYLRKANVGTDSVDRFSEGVSPVRVFAGNDKSTAVDHKDYPKEPVNALWPRIDEGDIVVYGSYMALEARNHSRVIDLLKHAKSRKAYLVYLPCPRSHLKACTFLWNPQFAVVGTCPVFAYDVRIERFALRSGHFHQFCDIRIAVERFNHGRGERRCVD